MSFIRPASMFALIAAASFVSTPALAGAKKGNSTQEMGDLCKMETPKIANSGIPEMDSVFSKAGTIQETVIAQTKEVCVARSHLNEALGIATDAPVSAALNDLKAKAMGKIAVAIEGDMPKLTAKEAVPENVQAGLDAANQLVAASQAAAKQTASLAPEAKDLAGAAAGFPMKVPTMKLDGVDLPTAIKVVGDNSKAMKALPGQIEALGKQFLSVATDAKAAFGG